ncbi:MAG: class I SAM-dependent methyltransferase [Flavobacteriales bacterium]|nr:class I SAM-dependent methyltransferase [Flavobacteriales bacterium]
MKNEWFVNWFDSKYYTLLYRQRDEDEARHFISLLMKVVKPLKGAAILDLACGNGRHSIALHELGFDVTGIDLSDLAIRHAKRNESRGLKFIRQDMRQFQLAEKFDVVFNLFTSFGYFDATEDNLVVLEKVHEHLKPAGWFILDYFNLHFVLKHLVIHEEKTMEGIHFHIEKNVKGNLLVKSIAVHDGDKQFEFEERVQLFDHDELHTMLSGNGFSVVHTFGNYQLDPFNAEHSDRLIIAARSL